jgi:MFS family permease
MTTAMAFLVISWPLGVGLALVLLGPLSVSASWPVAVQWTAWVCVAAMVLVAVVYRRPGAAAAAHSAGAASPKAPASSWRLSRREFALVCTAGAIWSLFNVAHVIVVSFAPALLVAQGLDPAQAAIVSSFANWPLIVVVPIAGMIADRTGRGQTIMLACFFATALAMPFLLAAPSPAVVLTIIGLLGGPAAGVIMTLAARPLSPQTRHFGMGLFYTLYYVGMTLLPPVAGWLRDLSHVDAAPLVFASSLLVASAALVALYRRVDRQ